jgi:hypothetical protein
MLYKKRRKKNLLKSSFNTSLKISQSIKKLLILIPSKWSILIVKDSIKNFYSFCLFSKIYYFTFSIPSDRTQVLYCSNTNVVSLYGVGLKTSSLLWNKTLNNILYLLSSFIFTKLKFKGKGYYIYKNFRNTITPQFGYYHRIYVYSFFNKVKFLSKTKVMLFGLVKKDILVTAHSLKRKRPINIFTGRGVRFARQIVYKKTGKVSSYR